MGWGEDEGVDLEVFLRDRADGSHADRATAEHRLAYAGAAVAGVISELDTMVFEHPEHGWRKPSEGDVAYDRKHKRVFRRSEGRWCEVESPQLESELERRVASHKHG
jgi:hypothetical protein